MHENLAGSRAKIQQDYMGKFSRFIHENSVGK